MKRIIFSLIAANVAGLWVLAGAQPVPGDYFSFTRFISDRNIFDPGRQPYYRPTLNPSGNHLPLPRPSGVQLVGTMSYEKGAFAFFDGSSSDLRKVLQVGDTTQGYTITEITANSVGLKSAANPGQFKLKIGSGLRHENGKWVISDTGEFLTGLPNNGSTHVTPAVPAPALEQNDVLKRLMEQRAKENQ